MSREEYEQSEQAFWEREFPRGPGDPDWYGYPGEPETEGEPSGPIDPEPF